MSKIPVELHFQEHERNGRSDVDMAELNFELSLLLDKLAVGSKEYTDRAKAFHEEVRHRPPC